ncbi:hypothetical protein JQ631_26805 [Bradyrhizobium manausense]|uniref:hypothetical protein n=1 Tax=Bradyrhizobium manausense TaxID=989370 RepID=UPI001BA61D86|nr:hypothetical protein [Bradyrhizobium manausense]MBR0792700.1 hypothetical protein [Bradyrhizobium manausense]
MAMEYSPDGATKVEFKGGLKAGLYETRNGKLYLIEDHDIETSADEAADRFKLALRKLLDE